MLSRGLKRKVIDCETMTDFSSACDCNRNTMPYSHQRQLVLNMCLNKLQNYKMLAEPNLHRSVLIANTVRQIQEETRQEANQLPGVVTDSYKDWNSENNVDTLMEVSDDDMSSAISSILKDLDFMEDTSPSQIPLAVPEDQPKPVDGGSKAGDKPDLKATECMFGSFEISSSTSYLKDLSIDDIFDDIDTSMYDSDFSFSSLVSPRTASASEEAQKMFSLYLNDLDHIMEILVGTPPPPLRCMFCSVFFFVKTFVLYGYS
uniref:SERTA domain-containing protein n=1 Tax=Leptobrachium leishanense TaxID=445787 RepID=A0A8C5QM10_9ANUR